MSWMAVRNRLPTKDRLREWGILMDSRCVLCQSTEETRDHLFFGCPYPQGIWRKILKLCNLDRRVMSWENELRWAEKRAKGRAMISLLLRVAWSAFIYNIWQERNTRIFAHAEKTEEQILNYIRETVRCRLTKLRNVKKDHVNMSLHREWNLDDSMFS